ncbi:hypothetical protein [Bradyrhizobium sp. 5.13L]
MLSRLISLLRRIPAVNWAFARLRPVPHGSIDVAQLATDASPALIEDVAAPAQAPIAEISTAPMCADADLATQAPVAENDAAVSVVAENPSDDICIADHASPERVTEIEAPATPPAAEGVSASPTDAESEPVADADLAIMGDASAAEIDSVVAEEPVATSSDVATTSTDVPDAVIEAAPSPDVSAEVETVTVEAIPVLLGEANSVAPDASEARADSGPAPAAAVASAPASDAPVVAAVATAAIESARAVIEIEPAPATESPAPEIRSAPKARARAAEPADRSALIRQRWAETGIRMWNPRLHGTGDAALNIQGSVGLLPPAAGETMPRYDKLEFRMLGGQIICEGVIVEAPPQANQRSFTRLAEPRNIERLREPTRERQAVLA